MRVQNGGGGVMHFALNSLEEGQAEKKRMILIFKNIAVKGRYRGSFKICSERWRGIRYR